MSMKGSACKILLKIIFTLVVFLTITAMAPYGYIIVNEPEKALVVGESWEMGEGFTLTVDFIVTTSAKITLSKDGKTVDSEIILISEPVENNYFIDGIGYVFQTTLSRTDQEMAFFENTELYAPDVAPIETLQPEAPPLYIGIMGLWDKIILGIMVSILIIILIALLILLKKPEILKKKKVTEKTKLHSCPDCGAKVLEGDSFCGECGKPLR